MGVALLSQSLKSPHTKIRHAHVHEGSSKVTRILLAKECGEDVEALAGVLTMDFRIMRLIPLCGDETRNDVAARDNAAASGHPCVYNQNAPLGYLES